ncbi:MAG TPA: cation diffusion facilitator family transporter [Casimicrobiaceae bacterium]|nr:cation diffusion facilitator family transporter [Casimicrobiaceae bacterium]
MLPASVKKYAWLSIAAALVTIALKTLAWWLTGSVGLLSDAVESVVNLAGALMALAMLSIAAKPADDDHAHGHGKAEYFSSAFEGLLILIAALGIGYAAIDRWIYPRPIETVDVGLVLSLIATAVNFATSRTLMIAAKSMRSIALEADAKHLMVDVWTSIGVVLGVGVAWISGLHWLDPLIAFAVAANIVWTGWQLLRTSTAGLMDESLPSDELNAIEAVLNRHKSRGLDFHALRTRRAGTRAFITLHMLVPGHWSVTQAHDYSERIEAELRAVVPNLNITTHIEPLHDPISKLDEELDREPVKDATFAAPTGAKQETPGESG